MSATRMPPPQPAQRVGAAPKKSESPTPGDDGPSFTHQLHAWLENHRASLVDSLRRLGKQPIGSFFTCLVMAVALSLPMGLALLLDNVERLGVSWQRAAQISLFLQIDATDAQGQALREGQCGHGPCQCGQRQTACGAVEDGHGSHEHEGKGQGCGTPQRDMRAASRASSIRHRQALSASRPACRAGFPC